MKLAILAIMLFAQGALEAQTFPPPGKLIDIGGRKLHLYCSGQGSHTVILMAGGGAFSIDWDLVQPGVARTTRVCSYDRAGLGWSDAGPEDETVEQTVSDLHAVLVRAGEKSPYILVGASIGGIFIQAYQRAYPGDVAGLIFSNSSHHIGILVNGKPELIWVLSEDQIRSTYPLAASAKGEMPKSEDDPFDRLPADRRATRLWLDRKVWAAWHPETERGDSTVSWRKEFLKEFALMDASQDPPLGALPVAVIASDPATPRSERNSHEDGGAHLDFLSSNEIHVTATGSGHEIHLYQPDVVVQTIQRAVSAIREKGR
jgi:pimeloyl-ACP methyl ester carboxylesterase